MKNFEKYKNQNDLIKAFFENRSQSSISVAIVEEFVKWREMEAEEEKNLPCPCSGGSCRCVTSNDISQSYRVLCLKDLSCTYSSGMYSTKNEAISAHNRMARAGKEDEKDEGAKNEIG